MFVQGCDLRCVYMLDVSSYDCWKRKTVVTRQLVSSSGKGESACDSLQTSDLLQVTDKFEVGELEWQEDAATFASRLLDLAQ
jgi:hypothetical protein